MRLSTRGRYGVAAMCELARRRPGATVALRDVASQQGLSEGYLEQLFIALRRAGLVRSVRGAQGGYALARGPAEITVGDVLRVVEGPIAPVPCAEPTAGGAGEAAAACARDHYNGCMTRRVWQRLASCMSRVLDGITLADLADDEKELLPDSCPQCQLQEEAPSNVR